MLFDLQIRRYRRFGIGRPLERLEPSFDQRLVNNAGHSAVLLTNWCDFEWHFWGCQKPNRLFGCSQHSLLYSVRSMPPDGKSAGQIMRDGRFASRTRILLQELDRTPFPVKSDHSTAIALNVAPNLERLQNRLFPFVA